MKPHTRSTNGNSGTRKHIQVGDRIVEYEIGSGNVFADAGLPDAPEALMRAELMWEITSIIRQRRLTQTRAAEILGTNQPTVSDLMRGRLDKFSLERLIGFLQALDCDVEITVKKRPARSRRPTRMVVGGD